MQGYPKVENDRIGHLGFKHCRDSSMAWVEERRRQFLDHHQYLPHSPLVQNRVSESKNQQKVVVDVSKVSQNYIN